MADDRVSDRDRVFCEALSLITDRPVGPCLKSYPKRDYSIMDTVYDSRDMLAAGSVADAADRARNDRMREPGRGAKGCPPRCEVTVWAITTGDGSYTHYENEEFKARRAASEAGTEAVPKKVVVRLRPGKGVTELADIARKWNSRPDWSDERALNEPTWVSGSVLGQLAQGLVQYSKGGKMPGRQVGSHFAYFHPEGTPDVWNAVFQDDGSFQIVKGRWGTHPSVHRKPHAVAGDVPLPE